MPHELEKPLQLYGKDAEDIIIMASFLQDALVSVQGIHYHADHQTLALFANRFRWELTVNKETEGQMERIHTGLRLSHVKKVHYKGFDRHEHRHHALNLLTIMVDGPEKIRFIFSEHAEIIVEVEKIEAHLQDLSEPWNAQSQPTHPEQ